MKEILYLVVPCYDEEEVLPETSKVLLKKMNALIKMNIVSKKSKILFVNDGSKDRTWSIIQELNKKNKIFSGISLSTNKGHQNALLAGFTTSAELADISISLDADLQEDIDIMDKFIAEYYSGSDVVYGVRCSRQTDTLFKRATAAGFYKFMKLINIDIVYNHSEYRLMSKRVVKALIDFKEVNLFIRGIVPLIGYKYSIVEYEQHERFAGKSKYPLRKMLSFAWSGITSFSIRPIRVITGMGFIIFLLSVIISIYRLIAKFTGNVQSGLTSLAISIWMIGGIQLLSLGVIGEYIGKIYNETKQRPRFIIADKLIGKDE